MRSKMKRPDFIMNFYRFIALIKFQITNKHMLHIICNLAEIIMTNFEFQNFDAIFNQDLFNVICLLTLIKNAKNVHLQGSNNHPS